MPIFAKPPTRDAFAVPMDPFTDAAKTLPKLQVGPKWWQWFSDLKLEVDEKPARRTTVNLSGQSASIATTALPILTVSPGIWRISYAVRVTTVAGVSSSIQVTLTWTEGTVVQTESGAALAGNLTTTREGATRIIRSDSASPISYSTTYASDAATAMRYSLDIVAEELSLDAA